MAENTIEKKTTAQMIHAALESSTNRRGMSYQAIRSYLVNNYNVDLKNYSTRIKNYLTTSVESGEIKQVSGKGVIGSFKISKVNKTAKKIKPKVSKSKLKNDNEKIKKQTEETKKKKAPPRVPVRQSSTKVATKTNTRKKNAPVVSVTRMSLNVNIAPTPKQKQKKAKPEKQKPPKIQVSPKKRGG